jgi:glycosyltransferase involved in cell wall biosynthesis
MRVLLIAEACNPEWVSVPLLGWSNSQAIAQQVSAHLVTQVRNRDAILRAGLIENRDFTAIDSEAAAAPLYKLSEILRGGKGKGWTMVTAMSTLAYPYFEHLIWKQFGKQIVNHDFDIVHRLTPLSPTTPSLLARRCRKAQIPFVLGPLNGGVPWPKDFNSARRKEREWLSYVRASHKLMPGYRSTRRCASALIIGSRDTWEQMPTDYRHKCIYIPENAIEPSRFTQRRTRRASKPLRIVFVGRLVPYKGVDMLLEAAAPLVRECKVAIEVIGDGPQMAELKGIVERESAGSGVTFSGWIEHAKLQDRYLEADVFAFPSIREFGGGVALEAMALGVVPIVVNYGGPAELVTENTGFLIPIGPRRQIIAHLRSLLIGLVDDPSAVESKAPAAIRRAEKHFTWPVKAQQILEVYRWVLDGRTRKPDFGMPLPD